MSSPVTCHCDSLHRARSKLLSCVVELDGTLGASTSTMNRFAVASPVVAIGSLLVAFGCSAGPDRGEEQAIAFRTDAGLEVLHDLEWSEGELEEDVLVPLHTSAFADADHPIDIYLASTDPESDFALETEQGDVVANSEPYGEFWDEERGESLIFRRITLLPDSGVELLVRVVAAPNVGFSRMALCDERVTNRANAGPGSLRQSISDVRVGGSVCFDPASFENPQWGPVVLEESIETTKRLAIRAIGPSRPIVTTQGSDRIFGLETATIRGLHLRDGHYGTGGLVGATGELTLRDVTLEDGFSEFGGALFIDSTGSLQMRDSMVVGNEALADGGGIWALGPVVITGSTLSDNVAGDGGGGIDVGSDLTMTNSVVRHNEAHFGGGISVGHGTMHLGGNSLIHSNRAWAGGGMYLDGSGSSTIDGASVFENAAVIEVYDDSPLWIKGGGGGIFTDIPLVIRAGASVPSQPKGVAWNTAVRTGGGILVGPDGTVVVAGETAVEHNSAKWGAGIGAFGSAALEQDAEVRNNVASFEGGGVFAYYTTVVLRNQASITANEAWRNGGGVYNFDGTLTFQGPDSRIAENEAGTDPSGGMGGGVFSTCDARNNIPSPDHVVGNTPDDLYVDPC